MNRTHRNNTDGPTLAREDLGSVRDRGFVFQRIFLGTMAVLCLAFVLSAPVAARSSGQWASGHILVQPKSGLPAHAFDKIIDKAGGRILRRMEQLNVRVVGVPAGSELAVAQSLSRNPHIKFAEVDALLQPTQTPNDPDYASAWHLPKINAPTAWDSSLGDGVTVAILDTGVYAYHLDLEANLVPGWNVVSNNSDTSPICGHGTEVAGTVGAVSNNGIGVASVAWHVHLMPVRITNRTDCLAYISDIANGIVWAADHGARVANISYQANGSATIDSAAQYMINHGGVVVIAAGNSGGDPGYPADPYVISVSATNSSDTRPSWSSYGQYVDVSAPGVSIWTTTSSGSYGAPSGTSFSSPVTAGVIALIEGVNSALSPDQVTAVLFQSAHDLGATGWDPYYGYGRVDAAAAVQLAAQSSASDTQAPTVSIASPADGSTVSGLVDVSVDATDNLGVSRVELYAGSQLVGTDTTAPYSFTWDSTQVADGDVTLVAYAYDAAGNRGQSAGTTVTVANNTSQDTTPPQVSITSPADGSTVSGNVTLSAAATDNVQVSQVSIYLDGVLECSGAPSVSCNWNTRKSGSGSHRVSATAQDTSGNTASTAVTVTVGGGTTGGSSTNGNGHGYGKLK